VNAAAAIDNTNVQTFVFHQDDPRRGSSLTDLQQGAYFLGSRALNSQSFVIYLFLIPPQLQQLDKVLTAELL
jgi:hypothetical protein